MLLGAVVQTGLFFLPLRPVYQYGPCLTLLVLKIIDNVLQLFGIKRNEHMQGVIPGRHAALLPNVDGTFQRDENGFPGGGQITVFLLSVKSNHPLGALAPGFRDLADFFIKMTANLRANAEEYGYLGSTNWLHVDERTSASEKMTVFYFRSLAGVHKFAHDDAHREGWDWWSKHARDIPFLGISHEAYEVPAGNWENVYVNMQPSGLGSASIPFKTEEGETKFASPVVDASRGKLRTHQGRKGEASGAENQEKYGKGVDPYEERVI